MCIGHSDNLYIRLTSFSLSFFLWLTVWIGFSSFCFSQKYQNPFSFNFIKGEKFKYKIEFLFLDAGEAILVLDSTIEYVNGNPCYKIELLGKTIGLFALGSKLEDVWRSYIDTTRLFSHKFHRDLYENGYTCMETTHFDHVQGRAIVHQKVSEKFVHKVYDIPHYAQDMISGYYYLRTIDFENYHVNDVICIDAFLENRVYGFKIRYLGKMLLKTSFGTIRSIVFSPIMPDNEIFHKGNSIKIWISDDSNHVLLKAKAKLFIGSIQLNLKEYNKLKEPFKKILK